MPEGAGHIAHTNSKLPHQHHNHTDRGPMEIAMLKRKLDVLCPTCAYSLVWIYFNFTVINLYTENEGCCDV